MTLSCSYNAAIFNQLLNRDAENTFHDNTK